MTERLRYDFTDEGAIVVDVPRGVFLKLQNRSRLGEILNRPERLVVPEQRSRTTSLTFDETLFAQDALSTVHTEAYASHWLYALSAINTMTPKRLRDPAMSARMGIAPAFDMKGLGRYDLSGTLSLPINNQEVATSAATEMLRVKTRLFAGGSEPNLETVHANVDEHNGIYFVANEANCSCLHTDGFDYVSTSKTAELEPHNLYKRQLVLTCFSGLVAVARAGSLHTA